MNRESFNTYEYTEYLKIHINSGYKRIRQDIEDGIIEKVRDSNSVEGISALYKFTGKEEIFRKNNHINKFGK